MSARWDVAEEGRLTVVVPRGDVVLAWAAELRQALADLVATGRVRILVDLAGVPYVDSSGLSALVAAMREARSQGGDVRLCGSRPEVRAVLELARLDRLLVVHATRAEALAAWR